MGFWDRLAHALSLTTGKRLAGRDLQGNKYYEIPTPAEGGRSKRSVKYRKMDHLSDYTTGKLTLPIQWAAWLSHTRPTPPTMTELQSDAQRQTRLSPMIAAIKKRERVERIRQGYGGDERRLEVHSHSPEYEMLYGLGAGAGPSTARVESTNLRAQPALVSSPVEIASGLNGRRSAGDREQDGTPHGTPFEQRSESTRQAYPVPTLPSLDIPPPVQVDPTRHTSKEDLRRLSEEDTKRRMAETGVPAHPTTTPKTQPASGLTPRRRGSVNSS